MFRADRHGPVCPACGARLEDDDFHESTYPDVIGPCGTSDFDPIQVERKLILADCRACGRLWLVFDG